MNALDRIIEAKGPELAALPRVALARRTSARSVAGAVRRGGVIAEIKRRSPSRGALGVGLDPASVARAYADAGAIAISVLTDRASFGGSFEDLADVRASVDLPLLCKDFIVDEAQLDEAARRGADAVLLIVAALSRARLATLRDAARARSLEVLVEIHADTELDAAHAVDPDLVGVNNRDLTTLAVDLATSERVLPRIARGLPRVAESGVSNAEHAARMFAAGADALLVGEALVTADDRGALLRAIGGAR